MLRRILVVEDDATLRGLFWTVLAEAGYAVLEAATVAEALELIGPGAEQIDLLISDGRLAHGPSGTELLRAARARRADLPLIALTGAPPERDVMAELALAGVRWLQKPIMPDRLVAEVAALIGPGH